MMCKISLIFKANSKTKLTMNIMDTSAEVPPSLLSVSMSDPRFDKVSALVRESYPKSCILWIDEIINPRLVQAYEARKEALKELRGAENIKEEELFHGTSEESARAIAVTGFDVQKNITAAYGRGTYFGSTAQISLSYMKDNSERISFMLLSKVIMGIQSVYGSSQQINTSKHDNSVAKFDNGRIVVCPYNDGALPMYIIAFYKHAR